MFNAIFSFQPPELSPHAHGCIVDTSGHTHTHMAVGTCAAPVPHGAVDAAVETIQYMYGRVVRTKVLR